jgi:ribose transport system substrate-binding protein
LSITLGRRASMRLLFGAVLALVLAVSGCSSAKNQTSGPSSSTSSAGVSSSVASSTSAATNSNVTDLTALMKDNSTAPPSTGPSPAKNKKIWIINCGAVVVGCTTVSNEAAAAAQSLGWKATVVNGNLNIGNGWLNAFDQAIAAHPDAILAVGPECATVKQQLLQAKSAHILTFVVFGFDCNDKYNTQPGAALYDGSYQPSYGPFASSQAQRLVEYANARNNNHSKMIELYYQYQINGEYFHAGYEAAMKECSGCQTVATVTFDNADMAGGGLAQKVAAVLAQHPEADGMYYPFSVSAQAGQIAAAVRSAGKADSMMVVGGEGDPIDLNVIRQGGGLTAEAGFSYQWMGYGSVDELNRMFNGQALVDEGTGITLIDKNHNLPPAGAGPIVSFDLKTAYDKLWGVS